MRASPDTALIDGLTSIISQAAAAVLSIRARALNARLKADQSPVTEADDTSESIIMEGVARLMPGVPIVSEEAHARGVATAAGREVLLLDPIDGTHELVAGRDEFTINLALVRSGRPVFGIVAAPALGLVWRTAVQGGAERLRLEAGAAADAASELTPIRTRQMPSRGLIAEVSRSHFDPATDAFLVRLGMRFGEVTRHASGSALKLCHVAEGAADIYPRLSPTHQWDIAAGHAILIAAGGIITTPDGSALSYPVGADSLSLRVPGFIAWGDPAAVCNVA